MSCGRQAATAAVATQFLAAAIRHFSALIYYSDYFDMPAFRPLELLTGKRLPANSRFSGNGLFF
jgi:hypothetical protein